MNKVTIGGDPDRHIRALYDAIPLDELLARIREGQVDISHLSSKRMANPDIVITLLQHPALLSEDIPVPQLQLDRLRGDGSEEPESVWQWQVLLFADSTLLQSPDFAARCHQSGLPIRAMAISNPLFAQGYEQFLTAHITPQTSPLEQALHEGTATRTPPRQR